MKSKINKFFAWIIVLLLVLGLVGFGLQDVLSRWGTSKLASIGEVEISSEEFAQSFIREINYISQNIGKNLTIEEAKSVGLHLQVMERLINRSLLEFVFEIEKPAMTKLPSSNSIAVFTLSFEL